MNINSVHGATTSASKAPDKNRQLLGIQNGNMVISFKGKECELTKEQAQKFGETLYNINYVRNKVDELKVKLASKDLTEEQKAKYEAELQPLEQKLKRQREVANFEVSPDGGVSFKLKKDINAEEFKELFYIEDGELRDELKKEALLDGRYAEKAYTQEKELPYSGYDDAWMMGVKEFSNGVYLEEIDDAGHYAPVYSKATMQAGSTYNISGDSINYPKESWFARLFGIGAD